MNRIDSALMAIGEIQGRLSRSQHAMWLRAPATAAVGLTAMAAAAYEAVFLPEHSADPAAFVAYWTAVAAVTTLISGIEIAQRYARSDSQYRRANTRAALVEFCPPVAAAAVLTALIVSRLPGHAELLPGLWAMLFALAVFATRRRIAAGGSSLAAYYAACGMVGLAMVELRSPFDPRFMAVTFGGGHLLAAALLWIGRDAAASERGGDDET